MPPTPHAACPAREGLTQARWQTLWIAGDGMASFQPNRDRKASPILALTATGRQALKRINTAAGHDHQYLLGCSPNTTWTR